MFFALKATSSLARIAVSSNVHQVKSGQEFANLGNRDEGEFGRTRFILSLSSG